MYELGQISSFTGINRFLSNFYPEVIGASLDLELWTCKFRTAEHAYHFCKPDNWAEKQQFLRMDTTPGEAKRASRLVTLRKDWDDVKLDYMKQIVLAKFAQNPKLQERLSETSGYLLIEGNTWHDNYWGCCFCPKCRNKEGQNHLGSILMEVRDLYA